MILALPYPPSINHYWRVVKGRPIKSREGRAYTTKAAWLAKAAMRGAGPMEGPVRVEVSVYRPRKSGDLDNTLKVLLDSMRGVVFVDDSQVVEIHARRNDDASNPRAIVTVEAA